MTGHGFTMCYSVSMQLVRKSMGKAAASLTSERSMGIEAARRSMGTTMPGFALGGEPWTPWHLALPCARLGSEQLPRKSMGTVAAFSPCEKEHKQDGTWLGQ